MVPNQLEKALPIDPAVQSLTNELAVFLPLWPPYAQQ